MLHSSIVPQRCFATWRRWLAGEKPSGGSEGRAGEARGEEARRGSASACRCCSALSAELSSLSPFIHIRSRKVSALREGDGHSGERARHGGCTLSPPLTLCRSLRRALSFAPALLPGTHARLPPTERTLTRKHLQSALLPSSSRHSSIEPCHPPDCAWEPLRSCIAARRRRTQFAVASPTLLYPLAAGIAVRPLSPSRASD